MMSEWNSLFAATAGASATLTGLLFIGVSINLPKILSLPGLSERALISIILLVTILIVSILMLVPGLSFAALGTRVLVIAVAVWIVTARIDFQNRKIIAKQHRKYYRQNIILDQVAVLAYIISGIAIIQLNEKGLYWLIPAITFSFVKAVMDAWVLLVEINR